MLRSLEITNFTAFRHAELRFSPGLNVIVGDNGLGKTHLLKLPYAVMAASAEEGAKPSARRPTKAVLQRRLAEKLVGVFRPDSLGRLTRRRQGRERCMVNVMLGDNSASIGFAFATQNKSEVDITRDPEAWHDRIPVFLPTRELLTLYPDFVSAYNTRDLPFDDTWRDTCQLLGLSTLSGARPDSVSRILDPLEQAIEGRVNLESNGRFYLEQPGTGKMEVHLIAEGWRKLGMLARLVAVGAVGADGCLFWDEPEANLNPTLIREVAASILGLCRSGTQVLAATHNLFLLRELEILLRAPRFRTIRQRYFALRREGDGVEVETGDEIDDIKPFLILDEDLKQSDRFMEVFQP